MLDDHDYITRFDTNNALAIAAEQWKQLEVVFELENQSYTVENIVFAGMGGSSLAAQLSLVWPAYKIPFEVCRGYTLPQYVNEKTLVIVSSYSGNTEEVLEVFASARKNNCHVITISAGGKLKEKAEENNTLHLDLPTGFQPRFAVLYSFKALVTILERCNLVQESETENAVHKTSEFLKNSVHAWMPGVPTQQNQAKQIAEHLMGKTPIIYGGILFPAAYKWKINCNENAKNTAWCGQYPEFNHNEFIGWSSHPVEKPFGVIDLISSYDHPRVQKRFAVSDQLLSGKRPKSIPVAAEGETLLEQLLWSVALGDMVSIYLAILNGVNPTPVDLIEKFKQELG